MCCSAINVIVYCVERAIEDHEIVVDIYSTWPRQNSNTFVFKLLETKYDLFEKPIVSYYYHVCHYHMFNIFRIISHPICH